VGLALAATFACEDRCLSIVRPLPRDIFAAGAITADNPGTLPWAGELDHTLFDPPPITPLGDAVRFTEAAFFHRPSGRSGARHSGVWKQCGPPIGCWEFWKMGFGVGSQSHPAAVWQAVPVPQRGPRPTRTLLVTDTLVYVEDARVGPPDMDSDLFRRFRIGFYGLNLFRRK